MKDIFLLDLDETLLDFKRGEKENLTRTLVRAGVPAKNEILRRFHEINDSLWKALERGEIARGELVVKRFGMLFEEFGIALSPAPVAKAYYEGFVDFCYPFEGAVEFVRTLSERGRVFIVTNGGAYVQKRHIADSGFAQYLSGVFISELVGYDKPDVRFARAVISQIDGFERERAVWLGDSLTSDMPCAAGAGIDFVFYSPSGAPEGAGLQTARSYAEALRIFSL